MTQRQLPRSVEGIFLRVRRAKAAGVEGCLSWKQPCIPLASSARSAVISTSCRASVRSPASSLPNSLISETSAPSRPHERSASSSIFRCRSVSGPACSLSSMRRYPPTTVTGVRNSWTASDITRGSRSGDEAISGRLSRTVGETTSTFSESSDGGASISDGTTALGVHSL